VEGLGNANFEEMEFSGGASDVTLDFSGSEIRSSKVNISIGAGSVRILLPRHAGVKIKYNDNFFSSLKLQTTSPKMASGFIVGTCPRSKAYLKCMSPVALVLCACAGSKPRVFPPSLHCFFSAAYLK
jgi:hypothetical protein